MNCIYAYLMFEIYIYIIYNSHHALLCLLTISSLYFVCQNLLSHIENLIVLIIYGYNFVFIKEVQLATYIICKLKFAYTKFMY